MSNRVLPGGVMGLIMISSLFVAVFMGASSSAEPRPRLTLSWVLVLTLAMAVRMWLAHPFSAPFGMDVDFLSKLANVARAEAGGLSSGEEWNSMSLRFEQLKRLFLVCSRVPECRH